MGILIVRHTDVAYSLQSCVIAHDGREVDAAPLHLTSESGRIVGALCRPSMRGSESVEVSYKLMLCFACETCFIEADTLLGVSVCLCHTRMFFDVNKSVHIVTQKLFWASRTTVASLLGWCSATLLLMFRGTKIVQAERNTKLFRYFRGVAYLQATKLIKDSASREKYQIYLGTSEA